jgi:hypothetical protein
VRKENLYKLKYETIIKNHDKHFDPNTVPSIFKRINKNNLKDEMYFKFKKYPDFLQHEIELCDECFMEHTKLYMSFKHSIEIQVKHEVTARKNIIIEEELLDNNDKLLDK